MTPKKLRSEIRRKLRKHCDKVIWALISPTDLVLEKEELSENAFLNYVMELVVRKGEK